MSPDRDQDYFAGGVSEDILNALSQLENINVVGRTSSFAVSDRGDDVKALGELLGARHILDGSVRIDDDRVRVTAQLIDAQTGRELWSESFDRRLDDAFRIQADIAHIVERRMRVKLDPAGEGAALTESAAAPDFETYRIYLQGVDQYRKRALQGEGGAIALLEQVLER